MALYIKDQAVNVLAEKLCKRLRASSKTEAVRIALTRELERMGDEKSMLMRLAEARKHARELLGPPVPGVDLLAVTDEIWGPGI